MNKILTLIKREYRAAVRTKSFIISLVLVPIMMGGGFLAVILSERQQDTEDKGFVVLDHTGRLGDYLVEAAEQRNTNEIFHPGNGEQTEPAFRIGVMEPDTTDPAAQQLALSERVKSFELHAFIEIGPGFIHSTGDPSDTYLRYYSEHAFNDRYRGWFSNTLNKRAQMIRAEALNLNEEETNELTSWIGIEGMGLVTVDKKTGEQQEAEKTNELQSLLIPYAMMILMFMSVMMSATPLITSVMEEKNEKIAEVLLGTVTPFQFMMGKVLGGIAVTLTTLSIYIAAGIFTLYYTGMEDIIPYDVLPWFFAYTILLVLMMGSGMAALGASCNDSKDASTLTFPGILPAIIPMFVIVPVVQDPLGPLATTMALIPPFTPTIMVIRIAGTVTIPEWQPIVGLVIVFLFTLFSVWAGARVFRTAILITGQKPTLANLVKYAFRS